jgi:SAM-dependent methyltransferase
MDRPAIQFDDGAAYERVMGVWSRLAGEDFLDWLAPADGLRWLDIGCGNGAFTELLVRRCAASLVRGIDPSAGQLAFARTRRATQAVAFELGDAMALPYPDRQFDVAVMALVVVFVADPRQGLREMVRVVRPVGTAAAYVWDMVDGGFPLEPLLAEMRAMGMTHAAPPQAAMSRMQTLQSLWADVGLQDVRSREITVERTFATFDDFWVSALSSPTVAPSLARQPAATIDRLRERVRGRVPTDAHGRIAIRARAHAIQGHNPA